MSETPYTAGTEHKCMLASSVARFSALCAQKLRPLATVMCARMALCAWSCTSKKLWAASHTVAMREASVDGKVGTLQQGCCYQWPCTCLSVVEAFHPCMISKHAIYESVACTLAIHQTELTLYIRSL
jgi:hypothetical protein